MNPYERSRLNTLLALWRGMADDHERWAQQVEQVDLSGAHGFREIARVLRRAADQLATTFPADPAE